MSSKPKKKAPATAQPKTKKGSLKTTRTSTRVKAKTKKAKKGTDAAEVDPEVHKEGDEEVTPEAEEQEEERVLCASFDVPLAGT